jgi:hypothetical protein
MIQIYMLTQIKFGVKKICAGTNVKDKISIRKFYNFFSIASRNDQRERLLKSKTVLKRSMFMKRLPNPFAL